MRVLFTQLSFLIGFVTVFELYSRQPNLPIALLLGISAACTMYIVLLLGDYAVHQYFEDKAVSHASLTYLNASYDPARIDPHENHTDSDASYEAPDAIAA